MCNELQSLINADEEETRPTYIILLEHELKPGQIKLLAELIAELKKQTGYGAITLHMREKSVQTMTVEKSYKAE